MAPAGPAVMLSFACSDRRFDVFTFVDYFIEGDPEANSVVDEASMESAARALTADLADRHC